MAKSRRRPIKADYPASYYAATANKTLNFPLLSEAVDCDVCIIGGGFTGLSSALHLAERGYRVVVLEAERIAWGASGRNGGQVGSGQRIDQVTLEKKYGFDYARWLWQLGEQAKALIRQLVQRYDIACDLTPGILCALHKPSLVPWAFAYVEKLQRDYGYPYARAIDRAELAGMLSTSVYYGGWLDSDALHLHPLNFALGLAAAATEQGAQLFEGSRVLGYSGGGRLTIRTAQSEVKADYLVLACNGYLGALEPRLMGKIMPINNFMLATAPLEPELASQIIRDNVAVYDSRFVVNYYRLAADRRLLFGGGETYSNRLPMDLKAFVRRYMLKIYPQLAAVKIDYGWGGTLAITFKRLPHVGYLQDNILFAHGYSGHGLGMATLAGQLIAEAIAGYSQRFELLMQLPAPSFPGGRWLRKPGLVTGMLYYGLRDRFQ